MSQQEERDQRIRLSLPVRAEGYEPDGTPWREMTATIDVGLGGASFNFEHAVKVGHVLLLSLPLPPRFRRYDSHAQTPYRVYSIVRTIAAGPPSLVEVLFLGPNPPKGFREDPTARYSLEGDDEPEPRERRRFPRLPIFLNLKLRSIAGAEELTVTENLSKWGARVMTSLPIETGDVIEVEEVSGDYRSIADVRRAYVGPDGVRRLNLLFNEEVPDRLIAQG